MPCSGTIRCTKIAGKPKSSITPIHVSLFVCFRSNAYNIGAAPDTLKWVVYSTIVMKTSTRNYFD